MDNNLNLNDSKQIVENSRRLRGRIYKEPKKYFFKLFYNDNGKYKFNNRSILFYSIIGVFLLIYLYQCFYYTNHFLAHTLINGINVSNCDAEKSKYIIKDQIHNYKLSVRVDDNEVLEVKAKEVSLEYNDNIRLNDYLKKQNQFLWFLLNSKEKNINIQDIAIFSNDQLLNKCQYLSYNLENISGDVSGASISDYVPGEGYQLNKFIPSKVDQNKIIDAMRDALQSLTYMVNCSEARFLKNNKLKDNEVIEKYNDLNKYVQTVVTYDNNEVVDGNIIHNWIVDNNGKTDIDIDDVKSFVVHLDSKYNNNIYQISLKSIDGDDLTFRDNIYIGNIDIEKETDELIKNIKNGEIINRKPIIWDKYNIIGSNYIEVNLEKQKLLIVDNGQKIMESNIVSGSKNNPTKTGIYRIYSKEFNFGNDMSIVCNDKRDKFGGNIYKVTGSLGNIELSKDDYQLFKNLAYIGMPIIVYDNTTFTKNNVNLKQDDKKKKENTNDVTKNNKTTNTRKKVDPKNKKNNNKKLPHINNNINSNIKNNTNNITTEPTNNTAPDVVIIPSNEKYDKDTNPSKNMKNNGPGSFTSGDSIKSGVYNSIQPAIRDDDSLHGPGVN